VRWPSLLDSAVVRGVLVGGAPTRNPYVLKWICLTTSLSDSVFIGTSVVRFNPWREAEGDWAE